MNICVVGVGYVGLVTAACFSEFGIDVTCVDCDAAKIDHLQTGEVPIYEPGLEELVERTSARAGCASRPTSKEGVEQALVIFLAVGTPPQDDGSADLRFVDAVAREVAETMDGYKVIVTKSTVPVGTGERVAEIIRARQKTAVAFDVVSNPEFLREGSAIEDFMRPNRVVIGASSEQAVAIMTGPLPAALPDRDAVPDHRRRDGGAGQVRLERLPRHQDLVHQRDRPALRAASACDVNVVAKGMGLDSRIGSKFLHAGAGFGGSCFPKDSLALIQMGRPTASVSSSSRP